MSAELYPFLGMKCIKKHFQEFLDLALNSRKGRGILSMCVFKIANWNGGGGGGEI